MKHKHTTHTAVTHTIHPWAYIHISCTNTLWSLSTWQTSPYHWSHMTNKPLPLKLSRLLLCVDLRGVLVTEGWVPPPPDLGSPYDWMSRCQSSMSAREEHWNMHTSSLRLRMNAFLRSSVWMLLKFCVCVCVRVCAYAYTHHVAKQKLLKSVRGVQGLHMYVTILSSSIK